MLCNICKDEGFTEPFSDDWPVSCTCSKGLNKTRDMLVDGIKSMNKWIRQNKKQILEIDKKLGA